jgi:hypothetical protein
MPFMRLNKLGLCTNKPEGPPQPVHSDLSALSLVARR